ncbi:MAG TPA: SDR family NAD(P)-dependent oxidoreductase [Steroidobacter sp.]|uniref:SDR family NAD(P)-dependent oxidoreductase n=1 Tax=Steroidobacter sp. TaxID=1978227 RepID=UPI002EDA1C74
MATTIYQNRFAGQTAVITGGASGVGLALAERFTKEGAKVSIWDRDAEGLEQARQSTGAVHIQKVDVSDEAQVAQAAKASYEALGKRIDILVASAGITGPTTTLWEYPPEEWRRVIDINLNGVFYTNKFLVPFMKERDYGRIVNISSVAGKEGNPNASAYSTSKAAVIGLTKSLGKELAKTGIRVNCVTPATFASPILKQLTQAQIDYMVSRIPIGRVGEIDEVASLCSWLASAECSFSTGATFDISGGRTTY